VDDLESGKYVYIPFDGTLEPLESQKAEEQRQP
jgi:hypothetical protein